MLTIKSGTDRQRTAQIKANHPGVVVLRGFISASTVGHLSDSDCLLSDTYSNDNYGVSTYVTIKMNWPELGQTLDGNTISNKTILLEKGKTHELYIDKAPLSNFTHKEISVIPAVGSERYLNIDSDEEYQGLWKITPTSTLYTMQNAVAYLKVLIAEEGDLESAEDATYSYTIIVKPTEESSSYITVNNKTLGSFDIFGTPGYVDLTIKDKEFSNPEYKIITDETDAINISPIPCYTSSKNSFRISPTRGADGKPLYREIRLYIVLTENNKKHQAVFTLNAYDNISALKTDRESYEFAITGKAKVSYYGLFRIDSSDGISNYVYDKAYINTDCIEVSYSDPEICSFNPKDGIITPLKTGDTTITLTIPNYTYIDGQKTVHGLKTSFSVSIRDEIKSGDINFSKTTIYTTTNKKITNKITKSRELDLPKTKEWKSSNPYIATVDSNGNVTARHPGEANISLRITNNLALGITNEEDDDIDEDNWDDNEDDGDYDDTSDDGDDEDGDDIEDDRDSYDDDDDGDYSDDAEDDSSEIEGSDDNDEEDYDTDTTGTTSVTICYHIVVKPNEVTKITAKTKVKGIQLSWKKNSDASYYKVYRLDGNKYKFVTNSKSNNYLDKKAKVNINNSYKISTVSIIPEYIQNADTEEVEYNSITNSDNDDEDDDLIVESDFKHKTNAMYKVKAPKIKLKNIKKDKVKVSIKGTLFLKYKISIYNGKQLKKTIYTRKKKKIITFKKKGTYKIYVQSVLYGGLTKQSKPLKLNI